MSDDRGHVSGSKLQEMQVVWKYQSRLFRFRVFEPVEVGMAPVLLPLGVKRQIDSGKTARGLAAEESCIHFPQGFVLDAVGRIQERVDVLVSLRFQVHDGGFEGDFLRGVFHAAHLVFQDKPGLAISLLNCDIIMEIRRHEHGQSRLVAVLQPGGVQFGRGGEVDVLLTATEPGRRIRVIDGNGTRAEPEPAFS